jgi:hypothetical protein
MIGVISGPIDARVVEAWIVLLRQEAGTSKVDWHFAGGSAVVHVLPEVVEHVTEHARRLREDLRGRLWLCSDPGVEL